MDVVEKSQICYLHGKIADLDTPISCATPRLPVAPLPMKWLSSSIKPRKLGLKSGDDSIHTMWAWFFTPQTQGRGDNLMQNSTAQHYLYTRLHHVPDHSPCRGWDLGKRLRALCLWCYQTHERVESGDGTIQYFLMCMHWARITNKLSKSTWFGVKNFSGSVPLNPSQWTEFSSEPDQKGAWLVKGHHGQPRDRRNWRSAYDPSWLQKQPLSFLDKLTLVIKLTAHIKTATHTIFWLMLQFWEKNWKLITK